VARTAFKPGEIRFGLGLIGIGRPWGHVPGHAPSERDARALLEFAYQAGVRYFDTAPSYGSSEQRLGGFLHSLSPPERAEITIATKFGEHWDSSTGQAYVDHRYDALRRSLDRSLERLGAIDVLQLHKTSPEVLGTGDLERAWESARKAGIPELGLSVSDLESGRIGCASGQYQMLQFPLNRLNTKFVELLPAVESAGCWVAANRPYAMGELVAGATNAHAAQVEAFRFVAAQRFRGVVLSGTKSAAHLAENLRAFREALGGSPSVPD
jgi:aryl-alcohol dehydrogenase-like predicted oxidoreductase